MTREEAILNLKSLKEDYWDDDGYGHETKAYEDTMFALDMAIEASEQEPCEDCVNRKTVIDAVHKQMFKFVDKAIDEQSEETDDKVDLLLTVNKGITGAIRSLPLAKAEQKRGHWLYDSDHPDRLICSTCNCEWDMWRYESKEFKYCPNCGCRMEGEK